ncbi:hypothetical protein NDU88_002765 [Pleurodeles waltl]|uniref:Reverse transcriptase domain-containing protein n=1 Tax=Pleurodeles waltl TaxID=8319 RepID=A0AAV7VDS3_PLEWA|nr:hypothetical protein NDU88_002765 [Pleurodeles waltl]
MADSTESALLTTSDSIRRLLDEGQGAVLVLLDLSVEFDTFSPQIMVSRLYQAGIRDSALKILESFLGNRPITVSWADFKAPAFCLPCGVPQASALSPTLFNVYVAPLAKLIRSYGFTPTSYADDTQLIIPVSRNNWEEVADQFCNCMRDINRWMGQNWLKLNTNKTKIVLCGFSNEVWNSRWWPSECGKLPSPSIATKNLEVIFDNCLCFRPQVNAMVKSSYWILKTLRKILTYLQQEERVAVILALVMSRLDYCNSLLLDLDKMSLSKLQLIQNNAARLILDLPLLASASYSLKRLHWLPVGKWIIFKTLCLTFKAVHGGGADYLAARLRWYCPRRELRSKNAYLIHVCRTRKVRWGDKAFTVAAAKHWNSLPWDIRKEENFLTFRRLVKTWLFPR